MNNMQTKRPWWLFLALGLILTLVTIQVTSSPAWATDGDPDIVRPDDTIDCIPNRSDEAVESSQVMMSSVSGLVWSDDSPFDGKQQVPPEAAFALKMVTVQCTCKTPDKADSASTLTNDFGDYFINILKLPTQTAACTLSVAPTAGLQFTLPNVAAEMFDLIDSDVDLTGKTTFDIPAGGAMLDLDAGLTNGVPASVALNGVTADEGAGLLPLAVSFGVVLLFVTVWVGIRPKAQAIQ